MLEAWRIVSKKFLDSAFTGSGARDYPGRWNLRNIPVIYASQSVSLAALEMLVHFDRVIPADNYFMIPIKFDISEVLEIKTKSLPKGWNSYPFKSVTQEIGSEWVKSGKTAVLKLPSAVIQVEHNYILNPFHKKFTNLKIGKPINFSFDSRL